MSCKYYLGNRTFKSELALDEYLMNVEKHYKEYGDEVFQWTSAQNSVRARVLKMDETRKKLYAEKRLRKKAKITEYSESYYEVDAPYVGVNDFLKNYKNSNGDILFPIFNDDNYWMEKRKDWEKEEYWKTADLDEIKDVFGDEKPHAIKMQSEFDFIREKITKKWKAQSKLGTAVHNAMSAFWSAKSDVRNNPQKLFDHVKEELNKQVSEEDSTKFIDFVSDERIHQIIDHCQKLREELTQRFGTKNPETGKMDPPAFVSEIGLTTDISLEGKSVPIIGVADLLVIDSKGNIQVIDYKTSPKTYSNYNSAKKRTFHYQLATYRRILERSFNLGEDSGVFVVPFQFSDFSYDIDNDQINYSGIESNALGSDGSRINSYLEELPIFIGSDADGIRKNLNDFIPVTKVIDATDEELLEENDQIMKEWFPSYSEYFELTTEKVKKKIENKLGGKIEKDPAIGKYKYTLGHTDIIADSDVELIEKVKNELLDIKSGVQTTTIGIKRQLKEAQKGNSPLVINGKELKLTKKNARPQWLQERLSKYVTTGWEVIEDVPEALNHLGIILVKNKFSGQIDVIKISNVTWQDLDEKVLLGGVTSNDKRNVNSTLTGNFENDILQKQRPNSLVLDSTYGNIELMQTMHALDKLPRLFMNDNAAIGEIMVIDTKKGQSSVASNPQLLYNYTTLKKLHHKSKKDGTTYEKSNYENNNIKVLKFVELASRQLKEIMARGEESQWDRFRLFSDLGEYVDPKKSTSTLDNFAGNPLQLRQKLIELATKIENKFNIQPSQVRDFVESTNPEYRLYYNVLMAIAELDGVNYEQQTEDHDRWFQRGILGLAGTGYDNPGNMVSSTLNHVAKQVNIAYQNVRDDMQKLNVEMRRRVNALKKAKEFGWAKSRTVGNQSDLYKSMYVKGNGKFEFKNPWDDNAELDDAEREFLQFSLLVINGNRYGIKDAEELLEKMESEGTEKYLKVPLTRGTLASRVSAQGLMKTLEQKLKSLAPHQVLETIKETVEGFITTNTDEDKKYNAAKNGELWEMTNTFDAGEVEKVRLAWFSDKNKGYDYFEQNLETLTLKHSFAFSLKKNMDSVFPTIKAAMMHLSMQGAIMNDRYEQDIQYLTDFIKSKIFNISLHPDHLKPLTYVAGEAMSVASKIALAFNPRQLYQALDGIWKDVSLVIRKPDGETSFTKDNMVDSFFWIYNDLKHFGDDKSMAELINEQYGINDMDMNTYVEKIHSDNVGMWNFWNIGFRFASRPDFYNRLTIFGAQMRGDGCFKAHKVKDGKLVYDWTEDDRFSEFAKGNTQHPKYKEQKALYIAMARQFMAEHAKNDDGTDFVLDINNPKPLPRAYTIQQSESMKSLSDLIYGYYSHEKKSLMQSTALGALFMQMNTYWSSKKNQYLAPGGVKMQGSMKQYEENGVKMWHKLDEEGNITDEMTDQNTGVPFMQWQGQYQEGILVTAMSMVNDVFKGDAEGNHSVSDVWDKYYNNADPNLQRAYRNNLKQLFYDLFMLLFVGMLVAPALLNATNEHIKATGNKSFENAFMNNCMLNTAEMFSSAADDFNMVHSIFGRGAQWTPFAIQSADRTLTNISKMITGNKDLYDGAVNMFASTRSQQPIMDFIKISTLGREIGDKGKEA